MGRFKYMIYMIRRVCLLVSELEYFDIFESFVCDFNIFVSY